MIRNQMRGCAPFPEVSNVRFKSAGATIGMILLGCTGPLPPPPPPARALPPPPLPVAPESGCVPESVFAAPPPEWEIYDDLDKPSGSRQVYEADDPREAAKLPYDAGRKAQAESRWDDARRAFRESWSLRKTVTCAFRLAEVSMSLERYREALHFIDFLLASKNTKDDLREPAKEWQKKALTLVAQLEVRTETGACVVIDGLTVGLAPLAAPVLVDGGEHHVEARHGSKRASTTVTTPAPGRSNVSLTLE